MRRWLVIGMVASLAWSVCPRRAPADVRLAAADDRLWRAVYDESENVTAVALRHRDDWRAIARTRGRPDALGATMGILHAFYDGGDYTQYLAGGGSRLGQTWPRDWQPYRVLAAAVGASDRYNPDIYLLLSPPAPAEGQPTTDAAPANGGGVLLVLRHGAWERVAAADPIPHDPTDTHHLVVVGGRGPYLLACTADGRPRDLRRLDGDQWTTLDEAAWEPDHRLWWLMPVTGDLLAAGTSDEGGWLRRVDLQTGALGPIVPIRRDDAPLPLTDQASLCPFGLTLAAAWRTNDTWRLGSIDIRDGRVTNVEQLALPTDVDERTPSTTWLQLFPLLIAGIVIFALLRRYQGGTAEPFALPADVQPAPLPLRLLAVAIDLTPFIAAGLGLMGLTPSIAAERTRVMIETEQADAAVVGAFLIAWGGYLIYAVAMELRFGATLGKLLLKLRVVETGGRRPTAVSILLRNATKPLETTPVYLIAAIFVACVIFTRYHQRVGDMLAGTAVIRGRAEPTEQSGGPRTFDENKHVPPPPPPE